MIDDLIKNCRSYRRFLENIKIEDDVLLELIKNASLVPSGSNLQPLKYKIINNENDRDEIFKYLKWAGHLKDWDGPIVGERPSSYIIILGDSSISKNFSVDLGIAAYAIVLSASEKNIGSCMVGSIDRNSVRKYLNIPEKFDILLVIALGYPNEIVVLEKVIGDNTKYYRDNEEIHHVPKRDIDDILIV